MLLKISYLVGWLVLAGLIGTMIQVALSVVTSRLRGLVGFVLASLIQAALIALPYASIWFLTGVIFVESSIALVVGMVGSYWAVAAARRLLNRQRALDEMQTKTVVLGMIEPAAQSIVRFMQTAFKLNGGLGIVAFAYFYFAYDPPVAADMMQWFVLYTLPIGILIIANVSNLFFIRLPFIDERLRVQLFKDSTIALLPVFMAIILVVYLLHPNLLDARITVLGRSLPMWGLVSLFAFASFLLLVVLPYVSGVRAGKKARLELLRRDKEAAATLTDAIFKGYWTAEAEPLRSALVVMRQRKETLEAKHKVIAQADFARERAFGAEGAAGPIPISEQDFDAYVRSDLRFRSHAFATNSIKNLDFTLKTNTEGHEPIVKRQVMDHMALHAIRAIGSFTDALVDVETARPRTFALFLTLGSIGSFVASVAGKVLLEFVFRAVALF